MKIYTLLEPASNEQMLIHEPLSNKISRDINHILKEMVIELYDAYFFGNGGKKNEK